MNRIKIASKDFPKSSIGQISQNGVDLIPREMGVTVDIFSHEENGVPYSAEVYATDDSEYAEDYYADLGLTFEGNKLVDYDGCFELPNEVIEMLKSMGYDTSEVEINEEDFIES